MLIVSQYTSVEGREGWEWCGCPWGLESEGHKMNILNEKKLIFKAQQNSNYIIINVIFLSFIMC